MRRALDASSFACGGVLGLGVERGKVRAKRCPLQSGAKQGASPFADGVCTQNRKRSLR